MKHVQIIGGGIAGLASARALVSAGHRVTLMDTSARVATGASGNHAGIFKPVLGISPTLQSELSFLAIPKLIDEIRRLTEAGHDLPHSTQGMLQFSKSEEEATRFRKALDTRPHPRWEWMEANEVRALSGVRAAHAGIFWKEAGWVSPVRLCQLWQKELETTGRFEFLQQHVKLSALQAGLGVDAVVVCAGPASREIPELGRVPSQLIRGQLSILEFSEALPPSVPLSLHEYVIPLGPGRFLIGATHDRDDALTDLRPSDHERLLERFQGFLPDLWLGRPELHRPVELRAGVRYTTSSRVPILGLLPETSSKAGAPVYAYTGLGSRGIHWSVLLSETLASLIEGLTPALSDRLIQALKP